MSVRSALIAFALMATAGCEARTDRWTERQAAVDPPGLWRVEALGANAQPVLICVDSFLRKGFAAPLPEVQGQPCVPLGEPVMTQEGQLRRCKIGAETLLLRTTTKGDANAFTIALRVTVLGARTEASAVQTRRYTRLGPCPEGWKVGDTTDQKGRRTNEAWPPAWR